MIAATLELFPRTPLGAPVGDRADRAPNLAAVFAAARSPARFRRLAARWHLDSTGRPVLAWHAKEQRP